MLTADIFNAQWNSDSGKLLVVHSVLLEDATVHVEINQAEVSTMFAVWKYGDAYT
jgi:hypothetical protein